MTGVRDLAELVRAPAALTVPGDVLAGAAAAGFPTGARWLGSAVGSVCLYWAGMALNDYADRDLDRDERPERPIPSGRVGPGTALAVATALTAAGVGAAALSGGRRALRTALPLAGTVWLYDLALKNTPAGPVGMAAARSLNVLMGSGPRVEGLVPALAVGAHTLGLTALSLGEVHGIRREVPLAALAGTGTIAAAVAAAVRRPSPVPVWLSTAGFCAAYAATVGGPQSAAVQQPTGGRVRAAVGAGILGFVPLQAALTARTGAVRSALALAAALPAARLLVRKVAAT
ncbi:SCO3242 family prenyltransferase [Actinocorallia sp. A-T 12471]|uniref:SCO3242 family prenyltransferase n=1 Tax=Actinocorallia sp. A-T 12471 TaxID=3089813 RepID=UPI0029D15F92|nr:UbiA family prenyltransferase [Actinocorallia sp. A-T 12471]MDX6740602.1 UbiA family prenyltransferase [Actinocorallia sp. A-T 12471]